LPAGAPAFTPKVLFGVPSAAGWRMLAGSIGAATGSQAPPDPAGQTIGRRVQDREAPFVSPAFRPGALVTILCCCLAR